MKDFIAKLGVIGLGLALIYFTVTDSMHPERWDEDRTHDPRIYLSLVAVVFPPLLYLLRRKYKAWARVELKRIRGELCDQAIREGRPDAIPEINRGFEKHWAKVKE